MTITDENPPDFEDDTFEVIRPEPKLTRLDKARIRHTDLEDKLEALTALPAPTDRERRLIADTVAQIERAWIAFGRENKRAADDLYRRNEAVDDWRKGEGRDEYNAGRRKVRAVPNADLGELTEDQKARRLQDQKNDSKWLKARKKSGMSDDAIKAAYADRIREREEGRGAQADDDADRERMENLPTYGMF